MDAVNRLSLLYAELYILAEVHSMVYINDSILYINTPNVKSASCPLRNKFQ